MGPGMALTASTLKLAAALAVALLVAGCGAGLSGFAGGGAGNQGIDLDSVPRDKIEAFGTPILRATIPARGTDLLLSPRDVRANVTTWESAEGITLAFRDGMLIETRGLGPDLMSSSSPSRASVLGGGPYSRSYFFIEEEDRTQRRDYLCTTEVVGTEVITIYGKNHQTRHIRETCRRDGGRLSNDFWFEGSTLRQSQQWISPDVGRALIFAVVD